MLYDVPLSLVAPPSFFKGFDLISFPVSFFVRMFVDRLKGDIGGVSWITDGNLAGRIILGVGILSSSSTGITIGLILTGSSF